jgi:hypothetical protein
MRVRTRFALFAAALALVAVLAGCTSRTTPRQVVLPGLAVAPFTNPTHNYELMAGALPTDAERVDPAVMRRLDTILEEYVYIRQGPHTPAADVLRCQQIVLEDSSMSVSRTGAFDFWLATARCVNAEYLLVPQIFVYERRVGSELGVSQPASVTMDLYVIDVSEEDLAGRVRFEETQVSLSENLLTLDKFAKRGGVWITAMELAEEGIVYCLEELGL